VLLKAGIVRDGHPFIEILVSKDKTTTHKFLALVDTGFSGFVGLSSEQAKIVGLVFEGKTAQSTLADGTVSAPYPISVGYASLVGDDFIEGTISVAQRTIACIGVDFIMRSENTLVLNTKGFFMGKNHDLYDAGSDFGFEINEE
jgi:predicted aspartyl protease